jgi:hypothetical protein
MRFILVNGSTPLPAIFMHAVRLADRRALSARDRNPTPLLRSRLLRQPLRGRAALALENHATAIYAALAISTDLSSPGSGYALRSGIERRSTEMSHLELSGSPQIELDRRRN